MTMTCSGTGETWWGGGGGCCQGAVGRVLEVLEGSQAGHQLREGVLLVTSAVSSAELMEESGVNVAQRHS